MSAHCPKDGGFIGAAGCTHPHHVHSPLVRKILKQSVSPTLISVEDADAALREGFYVKSKDGRRVGFGKNLIRHLDIDHAASIKDANARKQRLLFAIKSITDADKIERGHKGIKGRTAYAKSFDGFGILALSDRANRNIEYVFNFFPDRRMGLKKGLPR